jgi:hypothetical protein
MRRLTPLRPHTDLVAFIAVLATGVTLVALGLSPESLAAVTVALTGLHASWRAVRPPAATDPTPTRTPPQWDDNAAGSSMPGPEQRARPGQPT